VEVAAIVVFGPLEHQVLEEMREPRSAGMLVLRADVIPQIHGDHRQPPVFVDDDPKAVLERLLRSAAMRSPPPRPKISAS
jgi:hypothetical protein